MKNKILLAALVLMMIYLPVLAADNGKAVLLKYSFEDGEKVRYISRMQGVAVVDAAGVKTGSRSDLVVDSETTVSELKPDFYRLETNRLDYRMFVDNKPVKASDKGSKTVAIMQADGRISQSENEQNSPYQLKMPDRPVKPGDKWTHEQTLNFNVPNPELKKFEVKIVYKLQEYRTVRGRNCAIIKSKAIGMKPVAGDIESKIIGVGEVVFDIEGGRIITATNTMRVDLGIDQAGRGGKKARVLSLSMKSASYISIRD